MARTFEEIQRDFNTVLDSMYVDLGHLIDGTNKAAVERGEKLIDPKSYYGTKLRPSKETATYQPIKRDRETWWRHLNELREIRETFSYDDLPDITQCGSLYTYNIDDIAPKRSRKLSQNKAKKLGLLFRSGIRGGVTPGSNALTAKGTSCY